MAEHNPYAPPSASVAVDGASRVTPALWNPRAAIGWSILFSPVLGAYLHMRNWQALGQPTKASASRLWILGSIMFIVVMAALSFAFSESTRFESIGRNSGFVLLGAWGYFNARSQVDYVANHFGTEYPRRGWASPLLAALGVILAFFVVVMLVVVQTAPA